MLKAKTKTSKIKFKNKTKMEMQNIKQTKNIPPSAAFIRQLNMMGYITTNDHILIKVPVKENNKAMK